MSCEKSQNSEKEEERTTKGGGMMDITKLIEQAASALSYTNPTLYKETNTSTINVQDEVTTDSCKNEDKNGNQIQQSQQKEPEEEPFDLYDTMAALELRDVKMDSCEIPSTFYTNPSSRGTNVHKNNDDENKGMSASSCQTVPPRPAPTQLNTNDGEDIYTINDIPHKLPWKSLKLSQAYPILLESSTRLECYLSGSNLAESVYTNLYVHDDIMAEMMTRLYTLEQQVEEPDESSRAQTTTAGTKEEEEKAAQWSIYASSLLLVKLAQLVRKIVRHADIYEEEDFSISTYKFTFFDVVDTSSTKQNDSNNDDDDDGCQNAAEHNARMLMSNPEDMLDVGKVTRYAIQCLQGVTAAEDNGKILMMQRILTFYSDLYTCCRSLSELTKDNVISQVQFTKKIIAQGLENMDCLIKTMQQHEKDTKNKNNDDNDDDDAKILFLTFDQNVNRHLLGNIPMRRIYYNSPLQSIQILREILHQMDWSVCNLLLHGNSISRIQRMLHHVSTFTSTSPCASTTTTTTTTKTTMGGTTQNVNILNRSLIISSLYFDDLLLGQHVLGILIAKHMHRCGVPESITSNTEYGHQFLNRVGKPMYDTLKVLVLNRNRQRAFLDGIMFKDWNMLQKEAPLVDQAFQDEFQLDTSGGGNKSILPFVTNYILSITVGLMAHYVALGVELKLVTGHCDLEMAYWYLDFLLSTQLNILKSMRDNLISRREMQKKIEMEEAAAAVAAAASKKKRGKKGSKRGNNKNKNPPPPKPVELEVTPEDMEDNIDIIAIEVKRTISRGIVRFIAALNQAQIVSLPEYKFTTLEIKFQKRFQSFQDIQQPPPLTYDDFVKGSDFTSITPKDLLSSTTECFQICKSLIDAILKQNQNASIAMEYSPMRKEEAMSLKKVCVGNSLFLHKLGQIVDTNDDDNNNESYKVVIDFQANKQFGSIKLS